MCLGVLSRLRRRLDHRRCCQVHQPAASCGRATGGQRLQCRLGRSREERVGRGYHESPSYCGYGGHKYSFPTTAQSMLEGRMDVEHALKGEEGALPDRMHLGNRPPSAPERGGLGCTAQNRPILGPGLSLWSRACR